VNTLPREKRIAVLHALVNANSERSAADLAGVNERTVSRLAIEFGRGAQRLHDRIARELTCTDIECDETFSYVGKKQRNVKDGDPAEFGDAYTWTAEDRGSRFVIAFHVGKRDQRAADAFVADLRARLVVMPEMSTDGLAAYPRAVGAEFGPSISYGMMVKQYRSGGRDDHRYAPGRGVDFIRKTVVFGSPDLDRCGTAHMERQNGTMRHKIGRTRRLAYCFSKRFENHVAAVALGYVWYNVGWIVKGLRMTPAMAVGALDRLITIDEFHDLITEAARVPQDKPVKQPLAHRTPEGTSRELPNGRGFLRAIDGGNAPSTGPAPATPPLAAVPGDTTPALRFDADGQADLFSWTPKTRPLPPVGTQLDLFPVG
jgi:IS1 family transposase